MSKTITLQNLFHGTTTTVRPHVDERGGLFLTYSQVMRARRALCGIRGCNCGRIAGDRMSEYRTDQIGYDKDHGYYAEIISNA